MKYRINENLIWEEVNQGMVILNPEKGRYYNLNVTAKKIWKKLQKSVSIDEITNSLIKKCPSKEMEVKEDVQECLMNLLKMGLIYKE